MNHLNKQSQKHKIWKEKLNELLKGKSSVVVIGIGNLEIPKDSHPYYLIKKLKSLNSPSFLAIWAGVAPENFTGLIRKQFPELVLLVDTFLTVEELPKVFLMEANKVSLSTFLPSTHTISLELLVKFITHSIHTSVYLFGISSEITGLELEEVCSDFIKILASLYP